MDHFRKTLRIALLGVALSTPVAFAQDDAKQAAPPAMSAEAQAMMEAWQKASTPGTQHKQLADQFVGTWDTRITAWMDPSAPPVVETGRSVNTAVLGGRQVRMEYKGQFMGQPFEGVGFSGYDNVRGKYTGTWTDNMSTSVMMSSGDYDAATRTYTFRAEMPDMMKPGKTTTIRESLRIIDADHHVMEMYEPKDGKEVKTMMLEYSRAK